MYLPTAIYFSYKDNCADARVSDMFGLHKKTPAFLAEEREPLINYSLISYGLIIRYLVPSLLWQPS